MSPMHSTRLHSSHSHIKPPIYPPYTKHVPPVLHTRILSHFLLPSTSIVSAGAMQFKVTKAMSGAEADNKLKHTGLYDDPAFSADPTSNPFCAASHDISSWAADPPKGHPVIRPREAHVGNVKDSEIILIQPPNSPVYVNPHPQPIKPMTRSIQSVPLSPPSTSVPDLSSTASSASDSSLPTSSASHLSTTLPAAPPPPASGKKRIDLPFFRRKTLPVPNTGSQKPNTATHPMTSSSLQIQQETNNSIVNNSMPPHAFRSSQSAAGKARELDMIDELDETNPSGIALHHGGPYEGIQRMVHPGPQAQQAAYRPNQQQFRFDVSLNLSPGQCLPHSVTAYYRPQVPLGSVSKIQDRIGLRAPTVHGRMEQSPMNRALESIAKQYSTNHPVPSSAPDYMTRGSADHAAAFRRHVSSDPAIVLETNRIQDLGAPLPPPPVGSGYSSLTNGLTLTRDVHYDPVIVQHAARSNNYKQNSHAGANDESWKKHVTEPIDPRVTSATIALRENAEELRQSSPHGFQRASPVHEDHYRHPELRPTPSREASISRPSMGSSSPSIHSGPSSVMTGMTAATTSSRKRLLPRQLVMPAPLAKAAISSRPQPTHLQQQHHWQNVPRQHRIRFDDGTEYELPVTNMESAMTTPSAVEIPHRPTAMPPARTMSLSGNGKLKKQPSLRGPEPPEIVARLAAAKAMHKGKYMEPPPTIPEAPRIDSPVSKNPVKQEMRRLLSKRRLAT